LLKCDSADYPAVAAALYATYATSPSDRILDLVGGVDDIEAAYTYDNLLIGKEATKPCASL
jgi:hypothetical protein